MRDLATGKGVRPTLLISPNSLQILDALFRYSAEQLSDMGNVSRFARSYGLRQSKLSLIMTAMKARTLSELRAKISALPRSWWESAMHYPLTRKRLTPFFAVSQPYKSMDEQHGLLSTPMTLSPGPPELARSWGFLRDQDTYLWVAEPNLRAMKIKYRLVPSIPSDRTALRTWHLASPRRSFREEAITGAKGELNRFRAIWDLGFGDERMRQAAFMILERILHGV